MNDIFIHIDKKWDNCDVDRIRQSAKHSAVFIFSKYDVRWGTDTLVRTELFLFKKAYKYCGRDRYRYYHLLSGQDLPIKDVDYIYIFSMIKAASFWNSEQTIIPSIDSGWLNSI